MAGAVISRTDLGCNLSCEEITFDWLREWFKVPDNDRMFCVLFGAALLCKRRNVSKEDFYQWAVVYGEPFTCPNRRKDLRDYLLHLTVARDEELHVMSPNISGHYADVRLPSDPGVGWWEDRMSSVGCGPFGCSKEV